MSTVYGRAQKCFQFVVKFKMGLNHVSFLQNFNILQCYRHEYVTSIPACLAKVFYL
jgi:hypothetical protein